MKFFLIIVTTIFLQLNLKAQCTEFLHSNNSSDSWLSCAAKENPNVARGNGHWIQYDLGYVYPITSSHVWNYNVQGQTGNGFKDVVIDYSLDGINWIELGQFTFLEADGSAFYSGSVGPNFGDVKAKYILITALNNYGNTTCFGLAEFKFDVGEDVIIGIDETQDNFDVSLYPNPAINILKVQVDNVEVQEMVLRNGAGYEMSRYKGNSTPFIDVSFLPSGVYFLEFQTKNNGSVIRKFVKTNKE